MTDRTNKLESAYQLLMGTLDGIIMDYMTMDNRKSVVSYLMKLSIDLTNAIDGGDEQAYQALINPLLQELPDNAIN